MAGLQIGRMRQCKRRMRREIHDFYIAVSLDVMQYVLRSLVSANIAFVTGNADMIVPKVVLLRIANFGKPLRIILRHIVRALVAAGQSIKAVMPNMLNEK